jgi:hypothetical protein
MAFMPLGDTLVRVDDGKLNVEIEGCRRNQSPQHGSTRSTVAPRAAHGSA